LMPPMKPMAGCIPIPTPIPMPRPIPCPLAPTLIAFRLLLAWLKAFMPLLIEPIEHIGLLPEKEAWFIGLPMAPEEEPCACA